MRPLHDGSGTDGKVQLATWAAIVTHRAEFVDRPYDAARRAGGFTVPALLLHVLTGCIWGRKLPAEFIGADGGLAHGPILVTGVSRDKYIVPQTKGGVSSTHPFVSLFLKTAYPCGPKMRTKVSVGLPPGVFTMRSHCAGPGPKKNVVVGLSETFVRIF